MLPYGEQGVVSPTTETVICSRNTKEILCGLYKSDLMNGGSNERY